MGKKRRKRKKTPRNLTKPRFKRNDLLAGGGIITVCSAAAGYGGYRVARARVKKAEEARDIAIKFKKAIFELGIRNEIILRGKSKDAFRNLTGEECLTCTEEELGTYLHNAYDYAYDVLMGMAEKEKIVRKARDDVFNITFGSSAGGAVLGFFLAYYFVRSLRRHLKEKRGRRLTKQLISDIEERRRKRESDRKRKKEAKAAMAENAEEKSGLKRRKSRENTLKRERSKKKREEQFISSIRTIVGSHCSGEIGGLLYKALPRRQVDELTRDPSEFGQAITANRAAVDKELNETGWDVSNILELIESREDEEGGMICTGEFSINGSERRDSRKITDRKIRRQIDILMQARENPRGIDRRALHRIVSRAGFKVIGSGSGGGHLKLEYDGEIIRNSENMFVLIVRTSSGDLPPGTVCGTLDNLIEFLEAKLS